MRARTAVPIALVALLGAIASADADPEPVAAAPITELEKRLTAMDQEAKALRVELDAVNPAAEKLHERVVARGRILYRLVRAGLLPVGGGFDALVAHAVKVEKTRRALGEDMAELSRLSDRKVAIAKRLEDLALRRGPLELEQQAAVRARAALDEAEDRRLAFERAFQSSTGASDYVAVYGGGIGPGDPAIATGQDFRAMRGKLPFPLQGRAEIRTVRREGAGGPGLEMRASPGAAARAVYAGRVAFADRYDTFGDVVILDHGDRYFTLLGDLGGIDVRVGDDVPAGGRVGTVGSGGTLYVEIRRGAQTLEPGPWFGL